MTQPDSQFFDFTPDERRALGARALDIVLECFDQIDEPPVYPRVTAADLAERLRETLPVSPQDPARVIHECLERVVPFGRRNGHPRMFGYVTSCGSFMGTLGDLIASALNQNVTSWRSAPGPTTIELLVVDWIGQMVGYAPGATGLLTSGGSMANFAALAAALRWQAGIDVGTEGVRALDRDPILYASTMAHMSIPKAAAMLGLGRRAVRTIPVEDDFTMDVRALESSIVEDVSRGRQPVAVVASAGEVNTGAVDPIGPIADVCERQGVWLHVDGAYGGFAALAPRTRGLFRGIDRADSLALDPHKWLFAPLDAGCLLVRDGVRLRQAFGQQAAYVDVLGAEARAEFAFWDYGPELSRRFRALKLWMMLKCHGTAAIAAAIDRHVALAATLARLVDEAPDFERLAPVPLSTVCFRYVPASLSAQAAGDRSTDERLNAINRAITVEIQKGGCEVYISNATLGGRFALRASILNHRTTEDDLRVLLAEIRRVGGTLDPMANDQ